MELKKFFNLEYEQNSYLLTINKEAILIDPGFNGNKIIKYLEESKIVLKAIFCTHGHYDHTMDVDLLVSKYLVPVFLNSDDWCLVEKNTKISKKIESELSNIIEGELIIGPFKINCIAAPGHSLGSMIFIIDNYLFSGDVIFKNDTGRIDLYNSSPVKMKKTLDRISKFDRNYQIFPGHYQDSTLEKEKSNILKSFQEI